MGTMRYPFDASSWQRARVEHTGTIYYVNSQSANKADNPSHGSWLLPFSTWNYAISQCEDNHGDTIYLAARHNEIITTAGGVTYDKAGLTTIGIGTGNDVPSFSFATSTGASIVISGASFRIENIRGVADIDGLTNPFHIQAAGGVFGTEAHPIEWRDSSSTVEAARAILGTTAADRLEVWLRYLGFTAGNACVNAIQLNGSSSVRIHLDAYGLASTGWVEFVTNACTDVVVLGRTYTQAITNGSRNVVDTIGGSTWSAELFDASAGSSMSGGSGSPLGGGIEAVAALAGLYNTGNYLAVTADFTSATWNTVAAHEIATITGAVRILILPQCTGTLTSAGGAATLVLGDETTTNSIITSSDAEALATGEWWVDATITRTLITRTLMNGVDIVIGNGKDIGYTIGTEALTGGSVVFHMWWIPVDATGAVAAGAGGPL